MGPDQVAFVMESGMHVDVSVDGIREAHDVFRRRPDGPSSFDDVERGLRALVEAGARPGATMVLTPETAALLASSVHWLWSEGIESVHAKPAMQARWTSADRSGLRRELLAVGRASLSRRLAGLPGSFRPFEVPRAPMRRRVVVATSGALYPCAPMVCEDRDSGPEAASRIGRVCDEPAMIMARVDALGAGCSDGRPCACAAIVETGDRHVEGPNARWFRRLSFEIGVAVEAALPRSPAPRLEPASSRGVSSPLILAFGASALSAAAGFALGLATSDPPRPEASPPPPPASAATPATAPLLPIEPLPQLSLFQRAYRANEAARVEESVELHVLNGVE